MYFKGITVENLIKDHIKPTETKIATLAQEPTKWREKESSGGLL